MSTSASGSPSGRIEAGRKGDAERAATAELAALLQHGAIPPTDLLANLHVFLRRQTLSRLFFLNEVYQQILPQPGAIVQCGVRWGGDLVTFGSLRAMLEPYNYSRRIVGFDTFEGLKGTSKQDQAEATGQQVHRVDDGQYAVSRDYEQALEAILQAHEASAPLGHIRKFQLVKGDVRDTLPRFLEQHPGEIIALLYLDMDIYAPTKVALEAAASRLVKGSVVVFDELLHEQFPGEAQALREWQAAAGVRLRLKRSAFSTVGAYAIVDG